MIAALAKPIDRISLQLAAMTLHAASAGGHRQTESRVSVRRPASEVLQILDQWSQSTDTFFLPSGNYPDLTSRVAQSSNGASQKARAFQFHSACASPWPRNNVVSGKLFLSLPRPESLPTLLILHGWNHGGYQFIYYECLCRWLAAKGVNSALIELPYHGQRRPVGPGEPRNFLMDDLLGSVSAVQQAVCDARQVLRGLWAAGYQNVGLWGISLGGWIAGLVLAHEDGLKFAALTTPATRIDEIIGTQSFAASLRRGLVRDGVSLEAVAEKMKFLLPASYKPRLDPKRILLMSALHDQFISRSSIEELWARWPHPLIRHYPQGHISILASPRAMSDLVRFFRDNLGDCGDTAGS